MLIGTLGLIIALFLNFVHSFLPFLLRSVELARLFDVTTTCQLPIVLLKPVVVFRELEEMGFIAVIITAIAKYLREAAYQVIRL